jgi:glycosyltransferase involved in cell wall biosynthesis
MVDLAVIMSVYKNDKLEFLRESVNSILDQYFFDFDFFIAIDGPVISEIEYYLDTLNDERVRILRIEKNGGLAGALNYLLGFVMKNPDYKFIARMDADDISMPSRLEKQRDFLNSNAEVAIVGCWYEEIDEYGKHKSFRRLPSKHEDLRKRYYTRSPFAHPSVMYRRELIENAGFYPTDTVLMEDNVLWGKALKAGLRFANIPEYLLRFRKDERFYYRRSGIKYGWNYIKLGSGLIDL